MSPNPYILSGSVLALAALAACSNQPSTKPPAPPPDKIQGKAQINLDETNALDASLNAGGPSVYLVNGLNRYRLFFNKPAEVTAGKEYIAEGVYAQKAIDAIGDPGNGKNGYPLEASCDTVVRTAWPGLSFDANDGYSASLRAKVKRYPARPVFLVTQIHPVTAAAPKDEKNPPGSANEAPLVSVPADKQRVLLISGPAALPAPLWEPAGGTVHCKVVIDGEGKIAELNSGAQLCETVPWAQFSYRPTLKGGHPAQVSTEVEVRFDPRK